VRSPVAYPVVPGCSKYGRLVRECCHGGGYRRGSRWPGRDRSYNPKWLLVRTALAGRLRLPRVRQCRRGVPEEPCGPRRATKYGRTWDNGISDAPARVSTSRPPQVLVEYSKFLDIIWNYAALTFHSGRDKPLHLENQGRQKVGESMSRNLTILALLSLCACAQQQYTATKAGATEADRQQDMGACKVTLAQSPLPYQPSHGLVPFITQAPQAQQNEFLADCMRSKGWTVVAQPPS
jgi:hypothetical protein